MPRESGTVDDETARRAHRVLRAIWVIASAYHDDAVAADVARLGERLRSAIDDGDMREAGAAIEEVRSWLSTMAGVITSRMTRVFEEPV